MKRAFTLVELIVVIAIIAILTAIVMSNFATSKSRSRDDKRISDMGQIQLALTLYYDKCKKYPNSNSGVIDTTSQCTENGLTYTLNNFIAQIPTPPGGISGQTSYDYFVNDKGAIGTDYELHVTLESYNDALKSGRSGVNKTLWTNSPTPCYGGGNSLDYCLGPN